MKQNGLVFLLSLYSSEAVYAELFLAAFQLMADACFIIDRNGQVIEVNNSFEYLLGYQADQLRGKEIQHMLPEVRNEQFYSALQDIHCWSGEAWLIDQSELFCPLWLRFTPINEENGQARSFIGMLTKVRTSMSTRQFSRNATLFDPVTELINRHVFIDRCNRQVELYDFTGEQAAVILLNLDMFEDIHIALGHNVGDKVLAMVAERLKTYIPRQSLWAHLGADEFSIFTSNSTVDDRLHNVLDELISQICKPYNIDGREICISASVGLSVFPRDGVNANDLIDRARLALLEAKRTCRGSWCFYQDCLSQRGKERIELEAPLRRAVENNTGLELFYQPQVDLSSWKVKGAEALIRWQDVNYGAVSPERLVAIAECSALIESLGDWVLEEACQKMAGWRTKGIHFGKVAVNLSVRQFRTGFLTNMIAKLLEKYDLPPALLELEVTETAIEPDHDAVIKTLEQIRALECSVAIDDFGTGYSTLYYLQHFPADILKIDKSFVSGLPENRNNSALVGTIVNLAHNFGLESLAEGIETQEQQEFLVSLGCDTGQGFKYAQPKRAEQFVEWLKKH